MHKTVPLILSVIVVLCGGGETALQAQTAPEGQVVKAGAGPWGDLEYHESFLEPPDHILRLASMPSEQTEWKFFGMTPERIGSLFRFAGVSEEQYQALMDRANWIVTGEEIRLFPSAEVIRSLSAEARIGIYGVLGLRAENRFHNRPVVIEGGDVRAWFAGANLREEILQAISDLAYWSRNALLFSDQPYLLRLVRSAEEERSLLRALNRRRTLMLRLRLQSESDYKLIADYWTAGYKHKDIIPIMESVIRTEHVERLDIAHLLPPTPRKHLYAYPSLGDGFQGQFPDAFWTAINFFNFSPVNLHENSPELDRYVRSRYRQTQPPFAFGDLILVVRERDRQAIHACVYIADDIVYTKNGPDLLTPWVFMKLDNMLAYHQPGEDVFVTSWRLSDQDDAAPVDSGSDGFLSLP